jgi:hypothetical protein
MLKQLFKDLRAATSRQPRSGWRRLPLTLIAGAGAAVAAGMGVMYFLDPRQGRGRRKETLHRVGGTARRTVRRGRQLSRRVGAEVYGLRQKILHIGPDANPPEDDATLKHKVESILFRDPDVPKGDININAEHGVIVLRGTAKTPEQLKDIERRVREIDGVGGVENQLHLPNMPDRHWEEAVLSQRGGG